MPGRSRSSNGSAEATLERALKFMLRSDFVRKCQSRPHSSPGPRASSHRRPVVKVSLAVKGKVQIGWAPSPPSEGERDGVRGPLSGSWSQCMRTGERGLSMNHVTSGGFWLEDHVVFTGQFLEQTLFSLSDFLFIFLESLFHCSAGVLACGFRRRPVARCGTGRGRAVNWQPRRLPKHIPTSLSPKAHRQYFKFCRPGFAFVCGAMCALKRSPPK